MAENNQDEYREFAEEYRHIKADVRKVVVTNALILLALAGLYYANRQTGFVDQFMTKIF